MCVWCMHACVCARMLVYTYMHVCTYAHACTGICTCAFQMLQNDIVQMFIPSTLCFTSLHSSYHNRLPDLSSLLAYTSLSQ